jgi:DNA-binding LacI/PurR family transcriptional regulator
MAVTQKDIAEYLGISRSLVGEALGGHPKISQNTRLKVEAAARELGYDENSNRIARALIARRYGRRNKTGILAVSLPGAVLGQQTLGQQAFSNIMPFSTPFLNGIEWEANQRGFDIYLCIYYGSRPVPRLVRESEVDGIILLAPTMGWDAELNELKLPMTSLVVPRENAHSLLVDERGGMRQAIRYLVESGHRRIAYLGQPPHHFNGIERLAGYRDGLRECGLAVDENLIEASVTALAHGDEGMERLLARTRDFTAVVCYNDLVAMNAIRKLEEEGLRVPQEISVTGFDDTSLQFHFRPALTSVGFDGAALGRRAVQLLQKQVEREASSNHTRGPAKARKSAMRREVFPAKLAVRDSTAKAARL